MTPEEHAYYATHSAVSDPGPHAARLDALPHDPARLVEAVSGLVLHELFVKPLGITPDAASVDDVESRTMPAILDRILARDSAPLDVRRPPERRFIGICRDYALVACAALRHHGIPARVRVGFARYFTQGAHDDHWVCEYAVDGRWRLLDPQLSEPVRRHFSIAFSPAHVPRDAFVSAARTWLGIRRGDLDPARCGVTWVGLTGEWFVSSAVVRDLATLNKREVLGWDYWGITRGISRPGAVVPPATAARIDTLAEILAGPELAFPTVRATYEGEPDFKVPPVVLSCTRKGPIEVPVPV